MTYYYIEMWNEGESYWDTWGSAVSVLDQVIGKYMTVAVDEYELRLVVL